MWYALLVYSSSVMSLIPVSVSHLSTVHTDPSGLSPRQIKSDSDDDDLPNVTLDSVNETGSTALSIARAVQEWVPSSVHQSNKSPGWPFLLYLHRKSLKNVSELYFWIFLAPARRTFKLYEMMLSGTVNVLHLVDISLTSCWRNGILIWPNFRVYG